MTSCELILSSLYGLICRSYAWNKLVIRTWIMMVKRKINRSESNTKSIPGIIRAMYTLNFLIGIGYLHLMLWTSIGTTAKQHMLSVLNWCLALQTSSAILRPSATMPLLFIPSHILKGPVSLPIYFFALRLRSSEHNELQDSQYKVEYWNQHHSVHSYMVSGTNPGVFPLVFV